MFDDIKWIEESASDVINADSLAGVSPSTIKRVEDVVQTLIDKVNELVREVNDLKMKLNL